MKPWVTCFSMLCAWRSALDVYCRLHLSHLRCSWPECSLWIWTERSNLSKKVESQVLQWTSWISSTCSLRIFYLRTLYHIVSNQEGSSNVGGFVGVCGRTFSGEGMTNLLIGFCDWPGCSFLLCFLSLLVSVVEKLHSLQLLIVITEILLVFTGLVTGVLGFLTWLWIVFWLEQFL